MLQFLAWYFAVSILGWLTFPLAYRLFPALADRGYSLARALGLLIWGYAFWLMASLGIAQNDPGGLALGLLVLAALSAYSLWKRDPAGSNNPQSAIGSQQSTILDWLKTNLQLVARIEILFLVAFAFLTLVRAANPEITGTEKPMELAFINAILHSPTFPPRDPWLSGYAISYYYFGYVMTAMLAKLTATAGSVAFNLMLALVFALSAIGAYGILYNLLASLWQAGDERHPLTTDHWKLATSFLGPIFLLIVSNLEGFLEILHRRGLFWPSASQPPTFNLQPSTNFWIWLNIKDLNLPPSQPLGWIPERFWWWWRASRVVQDFDLAGHWREIIDEFPFFSYLLGDLHPHVLAMPFGLLAAAAAFNLFLGGWRGGTNLGLYRLPIRRSGFFLAALILGGLAFLNTWDIIIGFALVVGAYILARAHDGGWRWARLEDLFLLGLPLGILAILLYLPFYAGFSSQAGGILPNLDSPTRGAHLWVMFGSLFLPIFAYLIYLWRDGERKARWLSGIGNAAGLILLLWGFSWLMGWVATLRLPDFTASFLESQGMSTVQAFFEAAAARRLGYIGSLLTLGTLIAMSLAYLFGRERAEPQDQHSSPRPPISPSPRPPLPFVLLLILIGSLLVLAPEFVYLRDQFGSRMNTIFKFYYQAWLLWSLAAAFGTAVLLQELRGAWTWVYRAGLAILLSMALTYPTLSLLNKTNNFQPPSGWTLDGAAHLERENPDDAAAIRWLQAAPDGILAEASDPYASYKYFARISAHTGLPTVLGWPGHESQWRGSSTEQGTRQDDIRRLYETNDWDEARSILERYSIRYVVVGSLERTTYRVNETKFLNFLTPVFQQGETVIYEAPR